MVKTSENSAGKVTQGAANLSRAPSSETFTTSQRRGGEPLPVSIQAEYRTSSRGERRRSRKVFATQLIVCTKGMSTSGRAVGKTASLAGHRSCVRYRIDFSRRQRFPLSQLKFNCPVAADSEESSLQFEADTLRAVKPRRHSVRDCQLNPSRPHFFH